MTKYYKVLVNGRSCNGGHAEWSLPKKRGNGTWKPGDWMPEVQGPLVLCASGYHLTREPALWWQEGAECYVAEWDGEHVGDGVDKITVRRCRLLRRLTAAELASLRVFVEGLHQVSDGIAAASGSVRVEAYGSAQVRAYGSAHVKAHDSSYVLAHDSAMVRAHDSAHVWASDSSHVLVSGSAWVKAYDSAWVEAYDFSQVWAYGSSRVWAHDSSIVRTPPRAWGQPTVMTFGEAVWVNYHNGVPAVHTAEGRWEPVDSRR